MKKKIQKLTLNRETVRSLTDGEAAQAAGGTVQSDTKVLCKLSFTRCIDCP